MSDIRWIKVAVDMFEDSKIEFIRSLPDGDSIIVTWIQMLSIAGKSNANGYLMVMDGIPYTEQLLCNTLRRNPVFMQFAIKTLSQLKMINVDDGPIHITKWEKHQSVEKMGKIKSDGALRQQRYRERQKQKQSLLSSGDESNVTGDVTNDVTSRLRSKNKELNNTKELSPDGDPTPKFFKPTLDQVKAYCEERNNGIDAEKWYDHYTANGWKVGKSQMKDWRAAVRTWERSSNGSSTVGRTQRAARMPNMPTYDAEREKMYEQPLGDFGA